MLFIVPTFTTPGGTTIIMVPLVSWQPPNTASIILVTPESAIIINKCHLGWLVQARTQIMKYNWAAMTIYQAQTSYLNMAYWGPYQWIKSKAVVTAMAQVLGCKAYYSEQLDKARVLVIATTSALGMGVDIPNIHRVVEEVGCRWVVLDQYLDGVVDGYQWQYCQDADAGEQACNGEAPCEAGSMVAREGAREAACEAGSMVAREAAREAPCEAGSMVAREGAREAPCEAGSMVAREGAREAACEAGSMVAREAAREAACKSGSMVAREGAREAPCEAGSMVAREGAREAACEAGSMVARQAAREAPCKAGSMVAREGAREAPCEAGSMVAREAASPTPSNDSFCSQPSIPMAQQQHQTQQGLDEEIAQAEYMHGHELYTCHACEYRGFLIPMGQIEPVWQRQLQGMRVDRQDEAQEGHSQLFTSFYWLRWLYQEIEVNQH
ncbi:putative DEAD/DEAH box helicase [Aspergillus fumigatus]